MPQYIIDFEDRKARVVNLNESKLEAIVEYPQLDGELSLPLTYRVKAPDGKVLVTINSCYPTNNKINFTYGDKVGSVTINENDTLLLRADKVYDAAPTSLDDFGLSNERAKELGLVHNFKFRNSEDVALLSIFQREGKRRAVLQTNQSSYTGFMPVVILEDIKTDVAGRQIKETARLAISTRSKAKAGADGPFAQFVKQTFKPRLIEDAFPYQDQNGEKERFFEYVDSGLRPVILNGPTGNGKTVLTKDYAQARGLPFYFDTGNFSFRLTNAIGKFFPGLDKPAFAPGSLLLAVLHGGMYVLEEMPPIPQDEFTGLNPFLETGELSIITQFGYEVVTADPNFRFVATGNFHRAYTSNELNDASLQRFAQIKLGYPSRESAIDILLARAKGLDYAIAEIISNAIFEMRDEARKFSKDLGLKGPVEVAQRIVQGTRIPHRLLFEESIVNPLTTYENNIERRDGVLHNKLMEVVVKHFA